MTSSAPALSRLDRLNDRLNPVFVRDLQQALNGRAFQALLLVSVLAVATIGAIIGMDYRAGAPYGRTAFQYVMVAFTPIIVLVVPLQAFTSMRREIRAGTAELLLLTSLRPSEIVRGKLLAAFVQYGLWLSVFAPLLALTFLLRGVSVAEIGVAILLSSLLCLAATGLAVALGAFARGGAQATLMSGLAAVALAVATVPATMFMTFGIMQAGFYTGALRSLEFLGSAVLAASAAVLLLALCAQAQLTHAHENRSTAFRAFFVGACFVVLAWTVAIVPKSDLDVAFPIGAAVLLIGGSLFFLFASTEEEALSPRVRAHVPRSPLAAALAYPFLPGRGRGLAFALLSAAALVVVGTRASELFGAGPPRSQERQLVWMCALYGIFYAAVGCILRALFGKFSRPNAVARLLTVIVLLVACAFPAVLQAIAGSQKWSPIQILNPFWTIDATGRGVGYEWLLGVLTFAALLPCIPSMAAGLHDVRAASAARRRRATGA